MIRDTIAIGFSSASKLYGHGKPNHSLGLNGLSSFLSKGDWATVRVPETIFFTPKICMVKIGLLRLEP